MIYLVSGGSGSGKSAFAEDLAVSLNCESKYYIATMKPYGNETRKKIERHQEMRKDKHFITIECCTGLRNVCVMPGSTVLIECMSNLVANELYEPEGAKERVIQEVIDGVENLEKMAENIVIVTNEVFSDGVDYGADMELYLKCLGTLNRELAKKADQVIEVVYTIPVYHKGEE